MTLKDLGSIASDPAIQKAAEISYPAIRAWADFNKKAWFEFNELQAFLRVDGTDKRVAEYILILILLTLVKRGLLKFEHAPGLNGTPSAWKYRITTPLEQLAEV